MMRERVIAMTGIEKSLNGTEENTVAVTERKWYSQWYKGRTSAS